MDDDASNIGVVLKSFMNLTVVLTTTYTEVLRRRLRYYKILEGDQYQKIMMFNDNVLTITFSVYFAVPLYIHSVLYQQY